MVGVVSNKELQWLASVSSGIIMCKAVYELTGIISHLCFKGYGKLSAAKKVEWNNRGFSTFHAVVAAFASLYLLLLSDLYSEDHYDESIINRTSTVSETILGISIGYFLSDLGMILWYFPALGGLEYWFLVHDPIFVRIGNKPELWTNSLVKATEESSHQCLKQFVLHHGLSMFSIVLALISGQAQIYILMVLFTEVTTPFVNLRWYLDVVGQKSSSSYICNGVALFLWWLVARVLLFIYFFGHMAIHFDQVKQIFPLGFYSLLVVPPVLAAMNAFWFWKIVKGLIKTLSKARHSQ